MENIDRRELYTNFEKRIQYLHSYLGFGDGMLLGWLVRSEVLSD